MRIFPTEELSSSFQWCHYVAEKGKGGGSIECEVGRGGSCIRSGAAISLSSSL